MTRMPELNLEAAGLTTEEYALAKGIVATRGKNKGCLRASKPKVERTDLGPQEPGSFYHNWHIEGGETAYIWRMVAFFISPKHQHQCMPCTADMDLPGDGFKERKALAEELDEVVDKIVDTVPKHQWHGVRRWARTGAF